MEPMSSRIESDGCIVFNYFKSCRRKRIRTLFTYRKVSYDLGFSDPVCVEPFQ